MRFSIYKNINKMRKIAKKVKFPENLHLKEMVTESGRSVGYYAKKLSVSRVIVSNTINGHYKGINIVPKLLTLINQ